jgi:hypothetical protein
VQLFKKDWEIGLEKSDIFGAFIDGLLIGSAGFFILNTLKTKHRGVLFVAGDRFKAISAIAVLDGGTYGVELLNLQKPTHFQLAGDAYWGSNFNEIRSYLDMSIMRDFVPFFLGNPFKDIAGENGNSDYIRCVSLRLVNFFKKHL